MDPATEDALNALLPHGRTGDERHDLLTAARRAWEIRHNNTRHGGAVIGALKHDHGLTWDQIRTHTGIPPGTAQRWAELPPR